MPIPLFLGWPEMVIILIVVLVLFGGSRLAGVGKGVGRSIREFKDEVGHETKQVDKPHAQDEPVDSDSNSKGSHADERTQQ